MSAAAHTQRSDVTVHGGEEKTHAGAKRLVLFLLSPRVIDFDSYLPVAMALKKESPDWHIRFVTFSAPNYQYIRKTTTFTKALDMCGDIHYLGSASFDAGEGKELAAPFPLRIARRIGAMARITGWLLANPGALIFHGRHFNSGPYVLWYLLNKALGGKGYILARSRFFDEGYHPDECARFEATIEKQSLVEKLFGSDADGVIYYHDKQPLYMKTLGNFGRVQNLPHFLYGMPTLTPVWQGLIDSEAEVEKKRLESLGCNTSEMYVFFANKSYVSKYFRKPDSIQRTFKPLIERMLKLHPEATLLIRPHPLAMHEPYFVEALEELDTPRVVISWAHAEVLLTLGKCAVINCITNIVYSSNRGRFIDCSEYRTDEIERRGSCPFGKGFGLVYIDPEDCDFEERFAAALEDGVWDAHPELMSERSRLFAPVNHRPKEFMSWLDS